MSFLVFLSHSAQPLFLLGKVAKVCPKSHLINKPIYLTYAPDLAKLATGSDLKLTVKITRLANKYGIAKVVVFIKRYQNVKLTNIIV